MWAVGFGCLPGEGLLLFFVVGGAGAAQYLHGLTHRGRGGGDGVRRTGTGVAAGARRTGPGMKFR
jgi:hypothetical protein